MAQQQAAVALNKVEDLILGKTNPDQLARGLGWFSVALGMSQLLAPRTVARFAGFEGNHPWLVRSFGLRELMAGAAIFSRPQSPGPGLWMRVAGDAVDISTLALGFLLPKSNRLKLLFSTANVIGITALDIIAAKQMSIRSGALTKEGEVRVEHSIFINKTPEEVYPYWRNFEQLPSFMMHLASVTSSGDSKTHWVTKGPGGSSVEWDAQIVQDKPNELIEWRSVPGSGLENRGKVRFERAPGGRGTYLFVEIEYRPPVGVVGTAVAMLMREDPLSQMKDDLRRFKQIVETGEVIVSEGSPAGAGQLLQHPGQPIAS